MKRERSIPSVNFDKRAFDFFYAMSGIVGNEEAKISSAVDLAKSEAIADCLGWSTSWQDDPEHYDMGDAETEAPKEVLGCVLRDAEGRQLASLWSIGDPSQCYCRVVAAELASEALTELHTTISHHKALKANAVDSWIDIVAKYERGPESTFRHDLAQYLKTVLKLDRALR